jgi:predicted Ser/Thr protein kinase
MDAACPPADALQAFVAGDLDAEASAAVEAHIDRCAPCRTALSSLVRGELPEPHFGRYRVDTVIGGGGMGVVYRAHDPRLDRAVAIKVVNRTGDGDAQRDLLVREAQSLARLSHPHICHVYDVGRDGDEVWVAMELIDGPDLRRWAVGRPVAAVVAALIDAGRGLAAAHAAGLIHRDVKPENVLVAGDGRAVVTDFGLARVDDATQSTLAAAGRVSGTPGYLAPEQLTGAPLDARVDQFAWAVMAWELLAGERPFPVEPAARLAAIRAGVATSRRVPPALGAALQRALASAPRDRFESMDALLAALARPSPSRARWLLAIGGALAVIAGAAIIADRGPDPAPARASAVAPADAAASLPAHRVDAATAAAGPDAGAAVTLATAPVAPPTRRREPPSRPPPAPVAAPVDAAVVAPADAAAPADAGVAIAAAAPAAPRRRFDQAQAERVLATACAFPVDPRRLEAALYRRGAAVDWGPIRRHENVPGLGASGPHPMSMFEVVGARGVYRFDGDAVLRLGSFDAAVGDFAVVCPAPLPPVATVNSRRMPPHWSAPSRPIYSYARAAVVPRVATDLAALRPLHVAERDLTGLAPLPTDLDRRNLLVWARLGARTGERWAQRGWELDATDMRGREHLATGAGVWLVVADPRLEGSAATQRRVVRGVLALPSLLE